MKEGRLFCFVCTYDPLNWDASDHVLGHFGKLVRRRRIVCIWVVFMAFGLVV
jgi:hypothetical protein